MKSLLYFLTMFTILALTGCSGNNGGGAGYWFHIIFIMLPAGISLYLINKKLDSLNETVNRQADKLSNIYSLIDKVKKTGK